jgi:hypothetical protein
LPHAIFHILSLFVDNCNVLYKLCLYCLQSSFTRYVDLFEVSEVHGAAGNSDKPGGKATESTAATSGTFSGSQQPYNHLGWNADISGSTKEKQEQVPSISAMCIVQ